MVLSQTYIDMEKKSERKRQNCNFYEESKREYLHDLGGRKEH